MNPSYAFYLEQSRKIMLMRATVSFLSWDQSTYLPKGAAAYRAEQMGLFSGMAHSLATDKAFIDAVFSLENANDLDENARVNIRETRRMLEDMMAVPAELVSEMSQTIAQASDAWKRAREANRFEIFAPLLEKLVDLKNQELSFRKNQPGETVYGRLLKPFEPGLSVQEVDRIFTRLKDGLAILLKNIPQDPHPHDSVFKGKFDEDSLRLFTGKVLDEMGFDMDHGRIDTTIHPFCMGFHPTDVRVTYRYRPGDMSYMFWGLVHEGGHALYEQGLNPEWYGLPMGSFASLSVHESQSRFWENNICRSREFWEYASGFIAGYFPHLKGISPERFFRDANHVSNGFVRIDADELTYHFHVIIRYEIEKEIFENGLSIDQIPKVWAEKYKTYLGLDVPDDLQGVLQDIHWSHGMFGYFPTYTIGSLMAAQISAAIRKEMPEMSELVRAGQLQPVKEWLNENIHRHGMRFQAQELCNRISGEPLNAKFFLDYAKEKYESIYP